MSLRTASNQTSMTSNPRDPHSVAPFVEEALPVVNSTNLPVNHDGKGKSLIKRTESRLSLLGDTYHSTDLEATGHSIAGKLGNDIELGVASGQPTKKTKRKNTKSASADPYSYRHSYGWLFACLNRNQATLIAIAFVITIFEGSLVTLPPIILGNIVDIVESSSADNDNSWENVKAPLIKVAAAVIGKETCTFIRKFIIEHLGTKLQKKSFLDQARKLLLVRVDALQQRRSGELTIRLDRSVEGLLKLLKVTFLDGLPILFGAIIAMVEVFSVNWLPGTIACLILVTIFVLTLFQINCEKHVRIELNEKKAVMGGNVTEILLNMSYIRASGMKDSECKRLEDDAEALRYYEFKHHKIMMRFHGLRDLLDSAGLTAVVVISVYLAYNDKITSGGILTLALLYMQTSKPLDQMHKLVDGSHEAVIMIASLDIVRSMDVDPGLDGKLVPIHDTGAKVAISIENLKVVYGDNTVLENYSLNLHPGEVVGIAGPTGAGKTTVMKTLLGLIPDYQGSVRVLGNEVLETDKTLLSREIAYAQQEPYIRTGTLRDNLIIANTTNVIDDDILNDALKLACINKADLWPDGLDTKIHEGGRNLSGGEKQRLSLARVFLKNPSIIVLDEATSSLDNLTEAEVMRNFRDFSKARQCTVFMIAHRLSTLEWADRVIVMKEGKIIQSSAFQQLKEDEGLFQDLIMGAGSSAVVDTPPTLAPVEEDFAQFC